MKELEKYKGQHQSQNQIRAVRPANITLPIGGKGSARFADRDKAGNTQRKKDNYRQG
jgi:hypothetical protein